MNAPQPVPIAHHSVAVIGGGQAGLSISWYLKRSGIDHVVFEKERAGHAWRAERWDTFCLVTPNWQCQLPGFPVSGRRSARLHAARGDHRLFRRLRRVVQSAVARRRGGASTSSAIRSTASRWRRPTAFYVADQVVIAAGGYQIPLVPRCAERLGPRHRADPFLANIAIRRSFPTAPVLVVGSGQSGCQIAEDLHLAGRKVHLCVGDAPRVARRYRGKDVVEWLHLMGYYDLPVHEHPLREGVRDKTNHYVTGRDGGRDIDLRQRALEGMELYGRLLDVKGDRLLLR